MIILACACAPLVLSPGAIAGNITNAQEPPNDCGQGKEASDPVYLFSGEYYLDAVDLFLPGRGFDFRLTRTYRSKSGDHDQATLANPDSTRAMPDVPVLIGWNWTHSYAQAILGEAPPVLHSQSASYPVRDSRGRYFWFPQGSAGSALCAGAPTGEQYPCPKGDLGKTIDAVSTPRRPGLANAQPQIGGLTYVGLQAPDGLTHKFYPLYDITFDPALRGKLAEIADRNGNVMTFYYGLTNGLNDYGMLNKVVDTLGREILFSYDAQQRLIEVSENTPGGRVVEYEYWNGNPNDAGNLGDLKSVTQSPVAGHPSGLTWRFEYHKGNPIYGDNLHRVIDPRGVTVVENTYSEVWDNTYPLNGDWRRFRYFDVIVRQSYGGPDGGRYDYLYFPLLEAQSNGQLLHNGTITYSINRTGQVRRYTFDTANHLLQTDVFEGILDSNSDVVRNAGLQPMGFVLGGGASADNSDEDLLESFQDSLLTPPLHDPGAAPGTRYFTTTYEYNPDSLVTRTTLPSGDTIDYEYFREPLQPDGTSTTDSRLRGNIVKVTRTPGSGRIGSPIVREWTYDDTFGSSGGCGCGTSFAASSKDALGRVTDFDHDGSGNLTAATAPPVSTLPGGTPDQTIVHEFEYFATGTSDQGELKKRIDPDHDAEINGQPVTSNRTVHFRYYPITDPSSGLLEKIAIDVDGDGPEWEPGAQDPDIVATLRYNWRGDVTEEIAPRGAKTVRAYDERGLVLSEKTSLPSCTGSCDFSFIEFRYDANGNLVRQDTHNLDGDRAVVTSNPLWTTIHDYDSLNRRIRTCQEVRPFAVHSSQVRCIDEAHDDLTELSEFITTEYEYDKNDNLALIRKGEATSGHQPDNIVALQYDERNMLFKDTRGSDDPIVYDYDANGVLFKMIESEGTSNQHIYQYVHDGHDRLIRVTDPMGNVTEIEYDANGNRTAVTHKGELVDATSALGTTVLARTEMNYDEINRPLEVKRRLFNVTAGPQPTDPVSVWRREYFPNSAVKRMIDPRTHHTDTAYDAIARPLRMTDHVGNSAVFTYDKASNIIEVLRTDKRDDGGPDEQFKAIHTHDLIDRLVESRQVYGVNDASDTVSTFKYDSRNNRIVGTRQVGTSATDPDNPLRTVSTTLAYDGLSRLTQIIYPTGITNTRVWDASSRLIAQVDGANGGGEFGNFTRYAYDPTDRMIITRMADGSMLQVGDGAVWPAGQDRPNLTSFTRGYDRFGNALSVRDNNGSFVYATYDLNNRLKSRTIARAARWVTAPSGDHWYEVLGTTSEVYAYDGMSRIIAARDNDSLVLRAHDTLSRIIEETIHFDPPSGGTPPSPPLAGGYSTTYEHDLSGNVTGIEYPGGRTVTRVFDNIDRLKDVFSNLGGQIGGGPNAGLIARYQYAGPGRVTKRTYGNGTFVEHAYDGLLGVNNPTGDFGVGRTTRSTVRRGEQVIDDWTYLWDRANSKTARRNVGPTASANRLWHAFKYDDVSRMISTKYGTPGAGGAPPPSWGTTNYAIDAVHNRSQVGGQMLSGSQIGEYEPFFGTPDVNFSLNQYTSTPRDLAAYDWNGSLAALDPRASGEIMMELGGPGWNEGGSALHEGVAQDISSGGQVLDLSGDSAIDAGDAELLMQTMEGGGEGGMSMGQSLYLPRMARISYDYRNQMVKAVWTDSSEMTYVHTWSYDCFGRRIRKVTGMAPDGPANEWTTNGYTGSGRETRYINGGPASAARWQVLEEYSGTDGAGAFAFSASYVYGNYIDETLNIVRDLDPYTPGLQGGPTGGVPASLYLHHDDLFSATALSAGPVGVSAGGTFYGPGDVIERYEYGDFGLPRVQTAAGAGSAPWSLVGNTRLFTGREWDHEIEMYHYRTRSMLPDWGRFATRDPLHVWGDPANAGNAQAYVGTDPMSFIDPLGLAGHNDFHGVDKILGDPESELEFREYVERYKKDMGIPPAKHFDRKDLEQLLRDFVQENGARIEKRLGQDAYRALGERIVKLVGPLAVALNFFLITNEAAAALANPNSPCSKLMRYLSEVQKTNSECNETHLDNLGAACKWDLMERAAGAYGGAGAAGVQEAFDEFMKEVGSACRKHNANRSGPGAGGPGRGAPNVPAAPAPRPGASPSAPGSKCN